MEKTEIKLSKDQQAGLKGLSAKLGTIGGWAISLDKATISWSEGARQIVEWRNSASPRFDQLLGRFKPEYHSSIEEAINACINDGTPFDILVERVANSGRLTWVRFVGASKYDEDGRILQAHGAMQDITPFKEMEIARVAQERILAERTAQLEEAQRIGNIGGWSYDFETGQLAWTKQMYTIFGVEPDTFNHDYEAMIALVHPEDRDYFLTLLGEAQSNPQQYISIFRIVRPDGEVRYMQHIAEPAANADHIVYAGTTQDVTRMVTNERALRASEERFRLVTDVAADIIWDWDIPSGKIWWSDRESNRFGYGIAQGEATIEQWGAMIHGEDRGAMFESITAAMLGSEAEWSGRYRVIKADGGGADVKVLAKLIRDEDGHVVRIVGSINDETEQRMLESQLRSAQKLEALGQLTGGIAHDFNNLLTVILGNAELLEDALDDQPRLQALARMSRTAAERGGKLISRLLSFARRQPLDPKATDIEMLITDLAPLLRRSIGDEREIVTEFEDGLRSVKVDAAQLESALLNLCLNARDAMPGGGCITIKASNARLDEDYCSLHPDAVPGDYVLVAVQDTGCGMDDATMARALEPFFTTKAAGKGSGLGLSMVYGFATQSRGHLCLSSEPGHGTLVQLYLPRTDEAPARLPVRQADAAIGGHEHILLVEDDALVGSHSSGLLRQLGYTVTVAANGRQALALLREQRSFDLLFTDIVMAGGMNGRQLAEAALALRPSLPVLYTSGYAENAIVHDGQLEGGVHFLHKPYRKAELALKVREALTQARPGLPMERLAASEATGDGGQAATMSVVR